MIKVWQVNVIPGQWQLYLTRVRGKSVYQETLDTVVPLEQAPMYGLVGQIEVDHLERPNSLMPRIPWLVDVELIMTASERTKFLK